MSKNIDKLIVYERTMKIDLINAPNSSTDWGIWVSQDNVNWTSVENLTDCFEETDSTDYSVHTYTFHATKARYVKVIYGAQSGYEDRVDLREAEFWGTNK